jgi:AcrR family transcriptional regulator
MSLPPVSIKPPVPTVDHRVLTAARRRSQMRLHLLVATFRVFADRHGRTPVIEDVVREAKVGRGTFYKYFDSLDEALDSLTTVLLDQFTQEMSPIFQVYSHPWQRGAVGTRLFMARALIEPQWACFLRRSEAWVRGFNLTEMMLRDAVEGLAKGQFAIPNVEAGVHAVTGLMAHCMFKVGEVVDPQAYMDTVVHMALRCFGCSEQLCEQGVAFSRKQLLPYISGEIRPFSSALVEAESNEGL